MRPSASGTRDPDGDAGSLDIGRCVDGSLIRVRVTPKASSTGIIGVAEGSLRIRVQAPPVEGAANDKAREFLSESLGVSRGSVTLERGQTSRDKTFRVVGLEPEALRSVLASLLP
ncbi:MAG: hypothetical protein JWP91_4475 [Fibrobacteres bacterium]|nr:hypothetical protein [Fibrobacterota bacterium]